MLALRNPKKRPIVDPFTPLHAIPASFHLPNPKKSKSGSRLLAQDGKFSPFLRNQRRFRRRPRIVSVPCLGLSGRRLPALGGRKGGRFVMGGLLSTLFNGKKTSLGSSLSGGEGGRSERLEFEECRREVVRKPDGLLGSTGLATQVIFLDDEYDDEVCDLSRVGSTGRLREKVMQELNDHKRKLSREEFPVKLAERKNSAFHLTPQGARSSRKVALELFSPLSVQDENELHCALHGGNNSEVLVTHHASNIHITRKTLKCLNWNGWLNDEVVNLYLELLKEREKREPSRFLKCHFFNTFFFTKLTGGRNDYDYKAVRRWTAPEKLGYCLLECDKIFIPVHKNVHWCLAVINMKEKTFQYLDSLGGLDNIVLKRVARYLRDEVEDKNGKVIDTTWKIEPVVNLPLQKNGWDCGMFMLKYVDFYSRGLDPYFSQEHMNYFRERTAKEIMRLRAE